jgi:hypothetical protein
LTSAAETGTPADSACWSRSRSVCHTNPSGQEEIYEEEEQDG